MQTKAQTMIKLDKEQMLCDLQVNMSNALARSAHNLSLSEKRIVAACIAKTDQLPSLEAVKERGAWLVRLSAADYAETFDVDLDTAYDQLQAASKNLFKRYITATRQTKKGPEIYQCVWVGGVRYHKGEGWIELDWWHEIVPHLFNLAGEFTKYKLRQATALRSAYSWRLFELFQSWRGKGVYQPSLDDFCKAMEVPECYRKNFKSIRTRVIEPAVQELVEKNNMLITWKTLNAGRKVVGLDFTFQSMEVPEEEPVESIRPMIAEDQAYRDKLEANGQQRIDAVLDKVA
jgi:plasmid replication initiation protein